MRRSFRSVAGLACTAVAVVLVTLLPMASGAATTLGDQTTTYVPPIKVAQSEVLTWATKTANAKLQSILGAYPNSKGDTTRGVNGKTVTFGCVAPLTENGQATVYAGYCQGIEARFAESNKDHTVPWTLKVTSSSDTGTSLTTQITDLTTDVDTDHDFGIFLTSGTGPVGTNLLETQHVPFFGSFSTCGKDSIYGFDITDEIQVCAALETESSGKDFVYTNSFMTAYTKALHLKFNQVRYAGLSPNNGDVITYLHALEAQIAATGVKLVGNSLSLPTTSAAITDLSPYVTPLLADHPTIIGMYFSEPSLIARLMATLKANGYKGNYSAACTSAELTNPTTAQEVSGCMATQVENGYPAFGGKYWNVLTKAAKAMGQPTPVTQGFSGGWIQADMAVQGLKAFAASKKPLTAENLVNLMNHGWTYPGFGDVAGAQTYPYGKYNAPPCTAMAKLTGTKKKEVPFQDLTCAQVFFAKA